MKLHARMVGPLRLHELPAHLLHLCFSDITKARRVSPWPCDEYLVITASLVALVVC